MKKRVLEYVKKHQLIADGDRVIIGLSGGADSVCLLLMLKNIQQDIEFTIQAVHINHNLRGQEALRDQNFVDNLCRNMEIPLEIVSVDVAGLAEQEKIGLEEAGRKARYQVFEKYIYGACDNNDMDDTEVMTGIKIALAHHQNDLAETMIYHLSRGTDLAGLAGIRPKRDHYIRPLLCMTRHEIEQYLKEENVAYVIDSSNNEDEYTRNRIRHHVVEYLEQEVNARTAAHMSETAESLGELYDYLVQEGKRKLEQFGTTENQGIHLQDALFQEPKVLVSHVIRTCLEMTAGSLRDFTREHIQMILELAEKEVGKEIHLPYEIVAKREYSGLWIGKKEVLNLDKEQKSLAEEVVICPNKEIAWNHLQILTEIIPGKMEEIAEKKCTKWLDYDKIKSAPVFRYRKPGDYITINQQGGTKKIKSYFIDMKIPQKERDQIPLLCCGQEVLWVVGYRISEAYKVTKETKSVLKIQIRGGKYHE